MSRAHSSSNDGSARTRGRRPRRSWIACALVILPWTSSSCSAPSVQRRDWSQYTGPGAEYFQKDELPFPHVEDPIEPFNRVMAWTDATALRYAIAPLHRVYRTLAPKDVRERVYSVFENLLYPVRLMNNVLQWKWIGAGEETARFAINTTAGVGGLFDPARDMGIEPHYEDFGQTLAKWGWKSSTYFFLPVLGPSTIRDAGGKIPDTFADPAHYFFPATWARSFNSASEHSDTALRLEEALYDAYEPVRTLYVLDRQLDLRNFSWRRDESGPTQTLDAVFLTFEDQEFPHQAETRKVRLIGTHKRFEYSLWMQPHPAPLVYIVPGTGGHRLNDATLGLAEIAFQKGNSVVAISNPSNWEFIKHIATVAVPGYAPADAHDVHRALTSIDRDLQRHFPGRFTERRLTGISLGAFLTLFIAAAEEEAKREGFVIFDAYMALDVPVSLEHAVRQLDSFYNAPLSFPPEERKQKMADIFEKVLYLGKGELTPANELPFTRIEAQFLIGLAFRMDLQFVILQTQDLHDLGVLQTKRTLLWRAPAFREASEYSYMEYVYAFVLPYYSRERGEFSFDEAGAKELFARCDLHSIADALKQNDRVRIFSNENDFLLRPEDIEWMRETFGDRVRFFPAGGHLGNLHRKAIQDVIQTEIEKAAEEGQGTKP